MAKAKKKSSRGRQQDRARVAGGQYYEMSYEAKKTKRSASAVKKAVKKVGSSRKRAAGALLAFGGNIGLMFSIGLTLLSFPAFMLRAG